MRQIIHVQIGNREWEPDKTDFDKVAELFETAAMDPVGGIVVTRDGVNVTTFNVQDGAGIYTTSLSGNRDPWDHPEKMLPDGDLIQEFGLTPTEIEHFGSIVNIAATVHEINRAYCIGTGDDSQKPWAEADDWQQTSAIKGVLLHLRYPDTTAEQSHESWLAEKAATGWKYGEVKDTVLLTHPAFVPYDELPEQQKVKDYLFKATITQMALVLDLAELEWPAAADPNGDDAVEVLDEKTNGDQIV